MEKMRADMQKILSIMERQNDEQIHERVQSTNIPADSSSQNKNSQLNLPIKPVKWPEAYTYENRS
ncbi:hypothetical protein GcM3_224041 [Golovinomyces cichoracearum]|uniref:Uncharacterized protein n=1 Tax=Golovinomyces cichoracearum TaxID=62708 RepID=A0A420GJK9_9PEZI|nr:hypothetical protein GcM3_224041 [Golovinomyces cichoracearum]